MDGGREDAKSVKREPELSAEFQSFLCASEVAPPAAAAEVIHARISGDLNPSNWSVLLRLFAVVSCAGALTLLFCPHFGLGVGDMFGLMGLIMRFGDHFCQAVCGSIFVGCGVILATALLRPEELMVIRRNRALQLTIISSAFLGLFLCAGAAVISVLGLFWLAGAVLGGLLSFEVGWRVRFFILNLA